MTSVEYKAQLRNAVRHKVAALTVVEVESRYRAEKLIDELKPILAERPHETIYFPEPTPSAGTFLKAAYDAVRSWTPGEGVLFLVDAERIQPPDFWREMNSYRESWGALGCHVVFFLAPRNYRLLIQIADHLADWMQLKLHILGEEDRREEGLQSSESPTFAFGPIPSPKVVRDQLEILQKELDEALASGIPQPILIRRYYLPMFQAAFAIGNLGRAEAIRERIQEINVAASEIAKWFELNVSLEFALNKLSSAEIWARRLLDIGKKNVDDWIVGNAYHQLGMIAEHRRDLDAAEQWYIKSLEINERLGNESGVAGTYHQLGNLAEHRRDLDAAEQWYIKSLEIKKRLGNESRMAGTYTQLGVIAWDRRDLYTAEMWFRESLEIFERLGDEAFMAMNYHQLGDIAVERWNLDAAEQWYRKALEIEERLGNKYSVAFISRNLGKVAASAPKFEEAASRFAHSYSLFVRLGDDDRVEWVKDDMIDLYRQADATMKPKIKELAEQAGIELPSEDEHPPAGEDAAG